MTPLFLQIGLQPIRYRNVPNIEGLRGLRTTLADLCERADVKLRYTGNSREVLMYNGAEQYRAHGLNIVGVPLSDLESPEAALRALEALAFSFHDHGARACVCHQGLFIPRGPRKPIGASRRGEAKP